MKQQHYLDKDRSDEVFVQNLNFEERMICLDKEVQSRVQRGDVGQSGGGLGAGAAGQAVAFEKWQGHRIDKSHLHGQIVRLRQVWREERRESEIIALREFECLE